MRADRIEVRGDDGTYILVDSASSRTVGTIITEPDEPGWWRGTVRGGPARRLFVPGAGPLEAAARFLRR